MKLEYKMRFYAAQIKTRQRDGMKGLSEKTKHDLQQKAEAIARDFKDMGYKVNTKQQSPTLLTKDDFKAVVERWKAQGDKIGTMQDKAYILRAVLEQCGNKAAIIDNAALGISKGRDVLNKANINKAAVISAGTMAQLDKINIAASSALKLSAAYGLRKEEAAHVVYELSKGHIVNQGNDLALKGSWCKNGRPREFNMRDGGVVLSQVAKDIRGYNFTGRIENNRNAIDYAAKQAKTLDNNSGITPHALRHNYAQERYKDITGLAAPAAGGLKYNAMTDKQRQGYHTACRIISEELGHNREDISRTYLGK